MQDIQAVRVPAESRLSEKCQILVKKGFLTAKNVTSGVALLLHSKEFQLGVLLQLPANFAEASRANGDDSAAFAKNALSLIISEFEILGVKRSDLTTYAIGGSAVNGCREMRPAAIRRALWDYGIPLSAKDLGGNQSRSIWMDVETGRTIIRSEPILNSARTENSLPAAC